MSWYALTFRWPDFNFSLPSSMFRWPEFDFSRIVTAWNSQRRKIFLALSDTFSLQKPGGTMKNPLSFMPIFMPLLFFISPFLVLQPAHCSDLIDEVCKQTPYFDLCVSSLQSDPGSSSSDLKGLASIMASVVLGKARETLRFIEGLIKEATDEQTERCLAYCAELYIPVVKYNIPQAIDGLKKNQFGIAIDGISDGAKEADSCEKKVSASGSASSESELFVRNDLVHKLCDVSVAIVKMLEED